MVQYILLHTDWSKLVQHDALELLHEHILRETEELRSLYELQMQTSSDIPRFLFNEFSLPEASREVADPIGNVHKSLLDEHH
jgi:hypothetical protein